MNRSPAPAPNTPPVKSQDIHPTRPLDGHVAFVTGSSSGIGRGIALRLAQGGAAVVVHGRDEARVHAVTSEMEARDQACASVLGDLSDPATIDRVAQEALAAFGRVDILVNNAGVGGYYNFLTQRRAKIQEILDVNLRAPVLLTQRVAKKMKRNPPGHDGIRGRVINLASVDGKTGHNHQAVYDATKFAIVGLTQALAIELAPRKILVNAICPGVINTPMWGPQGAQARGMDGIYLDRYGTPADVAEVAAFLAHPRNSWMTGQSLNISGGQEFH